MGALVAEWRDDAVAERLGVLLDVVPGRIWAGDFRPARALADGWVGADGDLAAYLRTHRDDVVTLYRAAVPLWWNADAGRAYGMPDRHPADILTSVAPDALTLVADALVRILAGDPTGTLEFRGRRPDGSVAARQFVWGVVPHAHAPLAEVVTLSLDEGALVAEQARRMEELAEAAVTDWLTGVRNRAGLARALEEVVGTGGSPAMVAFDVPSFRAVNEAYGQEVGDACLRAIADVLTAEVREGDVVGRMGGDQFAVLLVGDGTARAEAEAVRLATAIEGQAVDTGEGLQVPLHVVGGIASVSALAEGQRSASQVVADVDIALSRAKRIRSTVRLLDADGEAHRAAVTRRLDWGRRVRAGMDDGSLVMAAQPVVALDGEECQGFELLVRLRDGDDLVPAGAFMPDIQMLGLTPLLDRFVAARAVALTAEHRDALGDRRLGFNVGATGLVEGDLLGVLDRAVEATGGCLTNLVVEMTETELVSDLVRAREVVEGLHERGVYFALDDFGSGAAVPEVLRALPVDMLKIDGNFVAGASRSPLDRAAVAGSVALADAMGIPVVAEWIEDAEALALMREMGVAFGQGYYFGPPAPVATAVAAY